MFDSMKHFLLNSCFSSSRLVLKSNCIDKQLTIYYYIYGLTIPASIYLGYKGKVSITLLTASMHSGFLAAKVYFFKRVHFYSITMIPICLS